jgi:hypothetical protein
LHSPGKECINNPQENSNQVKSESSIGMIVSLLIVVGFLALFYLDPLELQVTNASTIHKKIATITTATIIMPVVLIVSSFVGQTTLRNSIFVSFKNVLNRMPCGDLKNTNPANINKLKEVFKDV